MKINPCSIYGYAYRLLETVTPCKTDCGKRCGAACCMDSDAGSGMYLYPGEAKMISPVPRWANIEPSGFFYDGRETDFFSCCGKCERQLRPLACRIFPLVPYKKAGERMKIIYDPRALSMCPLRPEELEPAFVTAVTRAMRAVVKIREGRAFIEAQSRLIDEYVQMHL